MACVKLVVYSAGHGSVIFGVFFILHLCIQNLMLWMMTSLSLTSLRVNTDLMSLTQHHSLDKPVGFPLTVINMSVCPPPPGYWCCIWDQAEDGEERKEAQEEGKEVGRAGCKWWNQRWRWGEPWFLPCGCMFWFEIWPQRGPVSVYDMLY